jgi:RNA recognition motif-containing protein
LDWTAIRTAFSEVGVVELCLTLSNSEDGETLITFCTAESALVAVETYNNAEVNGQHIALRLNDTTSGRSGGGKRTVLVTNIPSDLHWRNVKSAFSVAGRVDLCRLKDGRAEIIFRTAAAAQKAVGTYHGGDLNGNRIAVRFFDSATGCVLTPAEA